MRIILAILALFIIFEIPTCFGMGLIFKKINLDVKKGMIPFYNKMILINKYKIPVYHLTLMFIPLIGFYTNYVIYNEICKEYNKDKTFILEITFLPCIFNIIFGLEKTKIENTEIETEESKEEYDEYVWHPKIKSDVVYKASRNSLNAKVNIEKSENNEIINNKIQTNKKEKENETICPNCGAKVSTTREVCFVCGTKL